MRRFLTMIPVTAAAVTAFAVLGWPSAAGAATLPDCLASHHVCVSSSSGRAVLTQGEQDQLEQQIGGSSIYLVVASAGKAGYGNAMDQIISALSARHDAFAVGFLDSGQRHFGAYSQGLLPSGDAARIATRVVSQHKADGDEFAALEQFVRDARHDEAPGAGGGSAAGGGGTGALAVAGIIAGILVLLAAGAYLFAGRPRRKRRERELAVQLAEAKAAAQEDLLALNEAITGHGDDDAITGSPDAAGELTAALNAYERGTRALDAARVPGGMTAVSKAVAEGRYRLACAAALAEGGERPARRPMCFFDPRHGMSADDVSWAPPDGRPSRDVAACTGCRRVIELGDQPAMRTVQDRSGARVAYADAGLAPSYWSGFGYSDDMLTGFLLGEAVSSRPEVIVDGNGYDGDPGYEDGGYGDRDDNGADGDFGGGDFGSSGGDGDFGGGGFGGTDDFGGGDFTDPGGDFGGGGF